MSNHEEHALAGCGPGTEQDTRFRREPFMFLHALHGEFSVFVFARTIGLAMAYDDSGFIIWKIFQVLATL